MEPSLDLNDYICHGGASSKRGSAGLKHGGAPENRKNMYMGVIIFAVAVLVIIAVIWYMHDRNKKSAAAKATFTSPQIAEVCRGNADCLTIANGCNAAAEQLMASAQLARSGATPAAVLAPLKVSDIRACTKAVLSVPPASVTSFLQSTGTPCVPPQMRLVHQQLRTLARDKASMMKLAGAVQAAAPIIPYAQEVTATWPTCAPRRRLPQEPPAYAVGAAPSVRQ